MSKEFKRRLFRYSGLFTGWTLVLFLSTWDLSGVDWLSGWYRWDSMWYEKIFREGYSSYPRMLVFPPGYPYLVGLLSTVLPLSFHEAAVFANMVCFFAALVFASEVAVRKFKISGICAFIFILSAPANYFVFSVYTDFVFFGALWFLISVSLIPEFFSEKVRKAGAVLGLLLLPLVRISGYALVSWIMTRRWIALLPLVTLGFWFWLNNSVGEGPLYFLDAQKLFLMPEGDIIAGLSAAVITTGHFLASKPGVGFILGFQFGILPLLLLSFLIFSAAWMAKKKHWLLFWTTVSILLISHNQSFWRSVVRYDLPVYPVLGIALLSIAKDRKPVHGLVWALVGLGFFFQITFARLFYTGGWAF